MNKDTKFMIYDIIKIFVLFFVLNLGYVNLYLGYLYSNLFYYVIGMFLGPFALGILIEEVVSKSRKLNEEYDKNGRI